MEQESLVIQNFLNSLNEYSFVKYRVIRNELGEYSWEYTSNRFTGWLKNRWLDPLGGKRWIPFSQIDHLFEQIKTDLESEIRIEQKRTPTYLELERKRKTVVAIIGENHGQ